MFRNVAAGVLGGLACCGLVACAGAPQSQPVETVTVTRAATDAEVQRLDTERQTLAEEQAAQEQQATSLDTRESAVAEKERLAQLSTIPGTGIFLVGPEILPGTYRATPSSGCYWERLQGTSGEFHDLIANGNEDGPVVVTISPSDVAFSTSRCGEWNRLS